jgi:hypothetical protein
MRSFLSRLLAIARNNPDYVGAVLTGYLFIGVNVALQIFLVPLYLSKLGYAEFGVLMILFSFVNFATVGVYGFASSVLRMLGEQSTAKDARAFGATYSVSRAILIVYGSILTSGMVAAVFWKGADLFSYGGDRSGDVTTALVLTAVYLLILFELSLNRVALNASGRQTAANIVQLIHYLCFGVLVVPLLLLGGSLWGVVACLLIGAVIARFCAWVYWRRSNLPSVPLGWSWDSAQPALQRFRRRSSLAYFLYTVICFVMQADVLIVGWVGGAEAAATFVLVWKIAEVLLQALGRASEHLQVEFIHMDVQGDAGRLSRVYRHGLNWMRLSTLAVGIGYALFGHWVVSLWVGEQIAPTTEWGYWLAGAAIVWLGSARLPAVLAYSRVRLKPLLRISGLELALKVGLIAMLFPSTHFLAPIIAINIVHAGGMSFIYARLGRKALLQHS